MFNSERRYGAVAMLLHWLIAFAIMGMVALGLYMKELPNIDPANPNAIADKFALFQLHKSIGLTILGLSVLRLLWRLINPIPALPPGMGAFERFAAHATHYVFYGVMIAIPLTGWLMVSASPLEIPTVYFNNTSLLVPHLPVMQLPVFRDFQDMAAAETALKLVHKWLALGTMGLLALHVLAALYHAVAKGDDVLWRMLPFTRVR